jgi:hypothetical protein
MNSNDLTREQLDALIERLRPALAYLNCLGERMDRRGFVQDELRARVLAAQHAMQDLLVALRYQGTAGTRRRSS